MPWWWRGQPVTDDDLIAHLCLRIGMIMEDVCGDVVMARAERTVELGELVGRLREASDQISALVSAADALTGRA